MNHWCPQYRRRTVFNQVILNKVLLSSQRDPHLLLQTVHGLARTEDRQNRNKAPPRGKSTDTGASSSGMTPSERARSLILPTTAPSTEVPRERGPDSEGETDGPGETDTIASTIEYPENPDLFLLQDDESWPFLDETCKLASNTASFSFCGQHGRDWSARRSRHFARRLGIFS